MTHIKRNKESGFTLVELAIVLVIIGLIVGGVLVGQDLIKAAEIRSTVADIERYNAAANTFRNKYNGLPGDLLSTRALQFGLTTRDGTAGQGDGNSIMEGCAATATALGCETAAFWIDLTDAQLISDAFTSGASGSSVVDGNVGPAAAVTTVAAMSGYLPSTALRESSFVHIYPQGGRNFFYMGALSAVITTGVVTVTAAPAGLTPAEASQIDDKVDDGVPVTGVVRAVSAMTATTGATIDPGAPVGTGVCVNEGATAGGGVGIENDETYNVANDTFASELSCNIYYRSSF